MNIRTPALLLLLLGASAAQATPLVDASDPAEILAIARGFGSAELGVDDAGDPNITGRIDGTRYGIYFYDCKNGRNCAALQFSAGWSGTSAGLQEVNAWNREYRFAKAYIDHEGDPLLEMDINTAHGISRANLESSFEWWQLGLKHFREQVLE